MSEIREAIRRIRRRRITVIDEDPETGEVTLNHYFLTSCPPKIPEQLRGNALNKGERPDNKYQKERDYSS